MSVSLMALRMQGVSLVGRLWLRCGSDRIHWWDMHTCPKWGGKMHPTGKEEFWTWKFGSEEVVYPRTISPEPNFPIKEISNLVSQPKVVKASFMRLAETYQDRNISSIAFPRFFEPNLFNDGAEIQKICNDFLSRLSIPTVVYTDYIPHSKTLIPLITKLVGVLSEEEKKW